MVELKQNILYVTRRGLYLHHEKEALKVKDHAETVLSVPMHHLEGVTLFGVSTLTPSLLSKCLQRGVFVSYLSERGRFLGRLEGAKSGNVLVRLDQVRKSFDSNERVRLSRMIVAGKIKNARANLLRSARDAVEVDKKDSLRSGAEELARTHKKIESANSLEQLRGFEGESAKIYFSRFDDCISPALKDSFAFERRMKRPPRNRLNALLSFTYSLLTGECVSACQAAGLDPYVGFLHQERPGRPSLALDLLEEFRAFGDRFVLTLINRKQIQPEDIEEQTGHVFHLTDDARKRFLAAYQKRKQEEIMHPVLSYKCRIGELPVLQARLLARYIRGDLSIYPPFFWK